METNVKNFFDKEKEYYSPSVIMNDELLKELVEAAEITHVERGIRFSDMFANNAVHKIMNRLKVPKTLCHTPIDHPYTFKSDVTGKEYCLLNIYYNPAKKDRLLNFLSDKFYKELRLAHEHHPFEEEIEDVVVFDHGVYNRDKTIGIWIPGTMLFAYLSSFLHSLSKQIVKVKVETGDPNCDKALLLLREIKIMLGCSDY